MRDIKQQKIIYCNKLFFWLFLSIDDSCPGLWVEGGMGVGAGGGVRPCGFSLIINRDGLLVCPCEQLATCPAGFICSPKRFTWKGRQNAKWPNASRMSNQASKSHAWAVPHSFKYSLILFALKCSQVSLTVAVFGFVPFVLWEDTEQADCSFT